MVSSALIVLSIQISMSFVVFFLLITWYLLPKIQDWQKNDKILLFLWIHVFRYTPLLLLAEGQVNSELPKDTLQVIAIGDFVSAIIALVVIVLMKNDTPLSSLGFWVFQIISTFDILSALSLAMRDKLYDYPLGVSWFILTLYVPLVIITQFFMLKIYLKPDNSE